MSEFWKTTPLSKMSQTQWESLCDGCGLCCLHKLEDVDSGKVFYTAVHCRYLDTTDCRCTVYPTRLKKVPDCVSLSLSKVSEFKWLPQSCAYRRIAEGRGLASWHPLRSGDKNSVHEAGVSVREGFISEDNVDTDDLQDYIVCSVC